MSVRAAAGVAVTRALGVTPVERAAVALTRRKVRIIAYHDVAEAGAFARQLDHLRRHYTPVSGAQVAGALAGRADLPDRSVWITFDDGDPTVVQRGLPALEAAGLPATMFVCPGLIEGAAPPWWRVVETAGERGLDADVPGGRRRGAALVRALKQVPDHRRREVLAELVQADPTVARIDGAALTTEDLRRWLDAGLELGNHTWDHPCLDRCDPDEQESQIRRGHDWLMAFLGRQSRLFAYPNGDHTAHAEEVLGDLGYEVGLLFDHRLAAVDQPRFQVSRLRLDSNASLPRARAVLSGTHGALLGAGLVPGLVPAGKPDHARTAPTGGRSAPIRVLGFTASTDRRGAEVFATQVAAALGGVEFDFDLWAIEAGTSVPPLDLPILGRGRTDPRALLKARRLAARADVVVAFGGSTLTLAAVATAGTGVPFVYRQIGDPSFWGDVPLARWRIGAPLRRAARVVSLWPAAAQDLMGRYGIDQERVRVIPNAGDGEAIRPPTPGERAAARRALGFVDEPVLLYLGSLTWEKRPADAIEAVALLPDVHLVVAGGGNLRSELEALAHTRAPGRVHFLGVVADVLPVLHAADALICPSATEGMAGCIVEAALAGLPVVATDVGAAGEVVLDGTTGRLIAVGAPAEAAAAVADVLDRSHELGTAARDRSAARFTFAAVMPQWADVLREVARTRSRRGDTGAAR